MLKIVVLLNNFVETNAFFFPSALCNICATENSWYYLVDFFFFSKALELVPGLHCNYASSTAAACGTVERARKKSSVFICDTAKLQ